MLSARNINIDKKITINHSHSESTSIERFEFFIGTRAKAIDLMPRNITLLKPNEAIGVY